MQGDHIRRVASPEHGDFCNRVGRVQVNQIHPGAAGTLDQRRAERRGGEGAKARRAQGAKARRALDVDAVHALRQWGAGPRGDEHTHLMAFSCLSFGQGPDVVFDAAQDRGIGLVEMQDPHGVQGAQTWA